MSDIIWHQLPKDLIKVICEFAKDTPPKDLNFQANLNEINWGHLARNPMSFSPKITYVSWPQPVPRPTIDDLMASANTINIDWDLLPKNIWSEEKQIIKPIKKIILKHEKLVMCIALLMKVRF
jgi:hypothetical protein